MKKQYIELLKGRRSRYALKKESPLSKEEIISLIEEVTKHTPSAFNSQSGRLVALFDKAHEDFWDLTKEEIRKVIPAGQSFAPTEKKMQAFKDAFGTVLFYEDYSVVRGLEEKFPLYKEVPGLERSWLGDATDRRLDGASGKRPRRFPSALRPRDRRSGKKTFRNTGKLGVGRSNAVRGF